MKRYLLPTLFFLIFSTSFFAQAPTMAEVMQQRITNAKAQIIVRNYPAAIYELENIRRESSDVTIQRMVNILLIHAYLEQGDYKNVQSFLSKAAKSNDADSARDYIALGGQVVSGAKTLFKRYQLLGLNPADKNLPEIAGNGLDKMRETLELVINHSRELGDVEGVSQDSMALLEASGTIRSSLARDTIDANRWENEVTYAREQLANSGSRIINAVAIKPEAPKPVELVVVNKTQPDETEAKTVTNGATKTGIDSSTEKTAAVNNTKTAKSDTQKKPARTNSESNKENLDKNAVAKTTPEKKGEEEFNRPADRKVVVVPSAERDKLPPVRTDIAEVAETKSSEIKAESTSDDTKIAENIAETKESSDSNSPVTIGSLVSFATKRVSPVYPPQARSMRMSGVVKVQVVVDEEGNVARVENLDGPALLKRAAQDAILKWQFTPFKRDGQPVKATGFVNFNFTL
ncbi:MAG: TonB family protein [Pyrinomonadaceae bacterium]